MTVNTCNASVCRDAQIRLQAMDFMLREANHRTANALQAVIAATAASEREGRAATFNRDKVTARISAIAAIHRLLSVPAVPETIAIGDYLAKLAESLDALWSRDVASIAVHHSGERVAADVAMRLGMVVNELVTNAFKYAYRDGARGEIRIAFSVMDGTFVLIVADDGPGIDTALPRRMGAGGRLIEDIAAQLEARFKYHRARPGTIAVLSGPAEILLPGDSSVLPRPGAGHAVGSCQRRRASQERLFHPNCARDWTPVP